VFEQEGNRGSDSIKEVGWEPHPVQGQHYLLHHLVVRWPTPLRLKIHIRHRRRSIPSQRFWHSHSHPVRLQETDSDRRPRPVGSCLPQRPSARGPEEHDWTAGLPEGHQIWTAEPVAHAPRHPEDAERSLLVGQDDRPHNPGRLQTLTHRVQTQTHRVHRLQEGAREQCGQLLGQPARGRPHHRRDGETAAVPHKVKPGERTLALPLANLLHPQPDRHESTLQRVDWIRAHHRLITRQGVWDSHHLAREEQWQRQCWLFEQQK